MFLPSQLVELSRHFQSDIEDLQVLLQEEGLPVRSAECLQQLSTRLGSDSRFRGDVAFLIRSMLGRERDEPGSMDVLGVIIVAVAGTGQEFDNPDEQLMRELLRFVIQQRRPAAALALTTGAAERERSAARPTETPRDSATGWQRRSPAPLVDVPDGPALPWLMRAEPEPSWRRVHPAWIAAAMAVLVVLGAGLLIGRGSFKAIPRELAAFGRARSAASPAYPAPSEPEGRALVPRVTDSSPNRHKSLSSLRRAGPRDTEPPPASMPLRAERTEPAPNSPGLKQPVISRTDPPSRPPQQSAAVSLDVDVPRQRGVPDSTDVSRVFAHSDAAAAASQVPPPVFRRKDPVLIARNSPAGALAKPDIQGTVHMGSTGTMASSLMYSPEPEYPARAMAAGVQGEVKVRAMVGPEGNVIDASIVSGPPLLREAALNAVGRWRYRPYEQDGKAVTIATTAILDFQLPPRK